VAGAGLFTGNVVLGHNISLKGQGNGSDPAADTILQALVADTDALTIRAAGSAGAPLTVANMRVIGGSGAGNGIVLGEGASHVALDTLVVTGAGNDGILLNSTGPTTDVVVADADISGNGHDGFAVHGNGAFTDITLEDSTLSGNGHAEAVFEGADGVTLRNLGFLSSSALYGLFLTGAAGTEPTARSLGTFILDNVAFTGTPKVALRIEATDDLGGLAFNGVSFDTTGDGNIALSLGDISHAPLNAGNTTFARNPGVTDVQVDNDVTAGLDFGLSTFTGATSDADILARFTLDPVSQVPFIILPAFPGSGGGDVITSTNRHFGLLVNNGRGSLGPYGSLEDFLSPAAGPGGDDDSEDAFGMKPLSSALLAVTQYFIDSGWIVDEDEAIRQLLLLSALDGTTPAVN
jgi:hypothetical protein